MSQIHQRPKIVILQRIKWILNLDRIDRVIGRFQGFKRVLISSVAMIPLLKGLEIEYYGAENSQQQKEYREFFGVRVVGQYAPTLTAKRKMEYKQLGGLYVGNNVLRDKTAMTTRPHYFQLSTFLYLLCVFLDCYGFDLVPRYMPNGGLM